MKLMLLAATLLAGCAISEPEESQQLEAITTAKAAFGAAVVVADFNGDKIDDLAVGAPGSWSDFSPGAVYLFKGTTSGLVAWRRITPADLDQEIDNNRFGEALAAGKIDDDDFAELVVGAPGSNEAFVLHGTSNGPSTSKFQKLSKGTFTDPDEDGGQLWGRQLVLHTEQPAFLAIGSTGPIAKVLKADLTRPVSEWFQLYATLSPPASSSTAFAFGYGLLIADLDRDGHRDVVVGAPGLGVYTGDLFVYRGTGHSFGAAITVHEQSSLPKARGDNFGMQLAFSSHGFDSDHEPEVAVLAPHFGGTGRLFAMKLDIANGALTGMHAAQGLPLESPENFPQRSLVVTDLDNDGFDDVIVGEPERTLGDHIQAGAIRIEMGSASGLGSASTLVWAPTSTPSGDLVFPDTFDLFGSSIAIGHFSSTSSSTRQLAVGLPQNPDDVDGLYESGAVMVLPIASGAVWPFGVYLDPTLF